MDTVLNLGLNADAVAGLAAESGNPRFAWDSYRRFIQMYASVVLSVPHDTFEAIIERRKEERDITLDTDLTAEDCEALAAEFRAAVAEETGSPFPDDPAEQLWGAISAVFR